MWPLLLRRDILTSARESLIKIDARGEDKGTPRGQETAEDWWAASPASCRRQPAGKLFLKINTLVAASLMDFLDGISSKCVPSQRHNWEWTGVRLEIDTREGKCTQCKRQLPRYADVCVPEQGELRDAAAALGRRCAAACTA